MRTVLAVTIALALCAPAAASAANTSIPNDLNDMVSAYQRVQAVRVVERFENGGVATVDVMPAGQYRVATTGGEDPALIVQLATHPVPDIRTDTAGYTTKSLGIKTMEGVKVTGYTIAKADGSYVVTVWLNPHHLPVSANVQTQGHKVSLLFGDYNNSLLIGAL